jgi:hypothetical protein
MPDFFYFIFNAVDWVRTGVIASMSGLVSFAASKATISAMQISPTPAAWWQNPAVIAAFFGILVPVVIKLIDVWRDSRKEEAAREIEDDERNKSITEKMQELTQAERQKLLDAAHVLHGKEVEFFHNQIIAEQVAAYENRLRSHRFASEVTRLMNEVMKVHRFIAENNLKYPEFEFKFTDKIMDGVEEQVASYRVSLCAPKASALKTDGKD